MKPHYFLFLFLLSLSTILFAHGNHHHHHSEIEMVDVKKLDPTIILDLRYATDNNVTGKKIYPVARCLLAKPAAKALVEVNRKLREKYGVVLKIFDGYRPLSAQKKLWEICPDERYVADPKKGSRHNRGCAVDISICDANTGKELEMPTGFDDFSEKAHRGSPSWSAQARINHAVLDSLMKEHGFSGIATEWWHYDYKGWQEYPILDVPLQKVQEK